MMDDFLYSCENFDICGEQEDVPNRMILREIVSVRLERVVKKCGLIKLYGQLSKTTGAL